MMWKNSKPGQKTADQLFPFKYSVKFFGYMTLLQKRKYLKCLDIYSVVSISN